MNRYRVFNKAAGQEDKIWRYTFDEWGIEQADKYIEQMHAHFQQLADKNKLWRKLPASILPTGTTIYFSHFKKHVIFFCQVTPDTIGIMSVLHESSDIPTRLNRMFGY